MRRYKRVFILLYAFALAFLFLACASPSDDDASNQTPSAYERYRTENPDYNKSEADWMKDSEKGRLEKSYRHTLIEDGVAGGLGKASGTDGTADGYYTASGVVAALNSPIILPLENDSQWAVSFEAALCPDGTGGGQYLNTDGASTVNRIAFGCNPNGRVFINYCIDGTWYNNGWDIGSDAIKKSHRYIISYESGLFSLSLDNGLNRPIEYLAGGHGAKNTAQTAGLSERAFAEKLSRQLRDTITGMTGQNYVTLTSFGGADFAVTARFKHLTVTTSQIYGYNDYTAVAHPLYKKKLAYLGSSITFGFGNNGVAFAEMIRGITGNIVYKEAVSGTTLATRTNVADSYVERQQRLNISISKPDILVVQFSTNDFSNQLTLGAITGTTTAPFDTTMVTGAIEQIIAYTRAASPSTKILFYAAPIKVSWAHRAAYASGLAYLKDSIAPKWGIEVCDMFNEEHVKMTSPDTFLDEIHATADGYRLIFTPTLMRKMTAMLA